MQFSSVYRPSKETLKLFRIKQLISQSNSLDQQDIANNFISYLTRNRRDLDYEDFGLGGEVAKFYERREFNTLWQEVTDV